MIEFSEKDIKLAKRYPKTKLKVQCKIENQILYISRYRINRLDAIKFAKWIIKSFEKNHGNIR